MILNGNPVADKVLEELKEVITTRNIKPKLGVVLVGEYEPSKIYVKKKCETGRKIGMDVEVVKFEEDIKEKQLLETIDRMNKDDNTHGIIVQLPLPEHIDQSRIINEISPKKDVDGFNPINMGMLLIGKKCFVPATAAGIIEILKYYKTEIGGKNAVVVGRSNIVGKPTAILLVNNNATVTVCHSKTRNLEEYTRNADILVVAVGKPRLITANMVKKGATIIDVGINRVNGKIIGDVDFETVKELTNITPVPGGVGPLTVAMLMKNVVEAALKNV